MALTRRGLLGLALAAGGCSPMAAQAPRARIILRLAPDAGSIRDRLAELEQVSATRLRYLRALSGGSHLLETAPASDEAQLRAVLQRLNASVLVDFAVREGRRGIQ